MGKIYLHLGIVLIIFLCIFSFTIKNSNSLIIDKDNNLAGVDMIDGNYLSIENNSKIKFNITIENKFKTNNNEYIWESSNKEIADVNNLGEVTALNPGNTIIYAKLNNKIKKIYLTVYEVREIVIIIGDSRMDHFKDDNNFLSTNDYEVKYKNGGLKDKFERLYVVSLSGMRYNWLAGEDNYKVNNATKYVKDIINNYEDKTNDTVKYNIQLLFNLGVNDLNHNYLDTSAQKVALKYLELLNYNMNNIWNSDIINNINLKMVTLFPINDKQVGCYFSGRYNEDVEEFNQTIKKNSKYIVCDAYNDLDFNDNVFRERYDNASCATRDGLHFSLEFNKEVLYPYLVNICANK